MEFVPIVFLILTDIPIMKQLHFLTKLRLQIHFELSPMLLQLPTVLLSQVLNLVFFIFDERNFVTFGSIEAGSVKWIERLLNHEFLMSFFSSLAYGHNLSQIR